MMYHLQLFSVEQEECVLILKQSRPISVYSPSIRLKEPTEFHTRNKTQHVSFTGLLTVYV
jgi:hypothetical protein